jgi:predicted ATPase/class 3 adenylate cyclase
MHWMSRMPNPSINSGHRLPSGTVTFLFTDIEGSTTLAQQFPAELPALFARHHAILQQAIEVHNGHVFQIIGDAFCAAFHTAGDALQAALDAQRGLQHETWQPAPIRVRMGLHIGAAQAGAIEDRAGGYVGYLTLTRVQRIMSVAHGGQVLLSNPTTELVRGELPADVFLRDIGEHRLKGLLNPEHLWQLVAPDLLAEFPPLQSWSAIPNNLPVQLTSFVGREKDIAEVKRLLSSSRLVTLTGSGGCGKTRLSIQVAGEILSDFTHGVWLVELAPLADPALVPSAIVAMFKLREDSQRTSLEVLTDYLRTKNILLVLDNCEHVIEACAQLSESLLHACPKLKILASSREALGIAGETPYRVPSLKTPDPKQLPSLGTLCEMDAIRLFLERAALAKPDFTLTKDNAAFVAQICFRLDGIPLAIELAAARMKVLSAEQIATRLDDRFRLLTGGARTALPRQQTLRAMIDWSYSLLSEQEKILFRRLAVFVGGWTLEAAESICGGDEDGFEILDLLTRLVDKSLVYAEELAGETRYRRLETIRQYSREKFFETDEVEAIRNRHLAFHVQFAEETERQMQAPPRKLWAQRSEAEQDNLRAAMEWGLAKNPESALQIAVNLVLGITSGGFSVEGFRWLRDGLEKMETTLSAVPPALRAKALSGLAYVYLSLGDNLNAKGSAENSIALYRQIGDKNGLAFGLVVLSLPLEFLGELVQAEAALQEALALARAGKNAFISAWSLNTLARVTAKLHGDMDAASRYTEDAIRISQEAGIEYTAANAYEMKGFLAAQSNHYDEARALFEKALLAFQDIGAHFNVILNKSNLAHLERQFGHHQRALERYRETILAFRDVGQLGAVAHQLECFGFIALAQNQNERALQLFAAARALREKAVTPMTPDEQVYYDEQLKRLRERMDSSAFESTGSKGSALSMDDAITLAIEETHD